MLEVVKFYEYIIENNTIKQVEYEAEETRKHFYLVNARGGHRFIDKCDFEKISNNRILSFNDDYGKYVRMLIVYQEQKLEKTKQKYEQQLVTFEALKKLIP